MITLAPGITIDKNGQVTAHGSLMGHISGIERRDIRDAWQQWLQADRSKGNRHV
jgi:hypothetical protein